MLKSYAQNKKSIYTWREKNREAFNAVSKRNEVRKSNWKKISKIYLNILL
jgi:hypothetical protein